MLKKAALVLGAIIIVLCAVVATRPDTYHVERSATFAAPPAVAFAQVNDFHKWAAWSPWEQLDPTMKKTFEGSADGKGAVYAWTGNDKVGEGRMTILDSQPGQKVAIKLEFIKPWTSTCDTTFTFAPADGGTKVTWAMDGQNNFMSKAMSLVKDMDHMIGPDFEKGLAQMRVPAETEAKRLAAAEAAARAAAQAAAAPAPAATATP